MKKFLSVLTVGILLLSNCNLMYAQYSSSGEEFNNYWEMITPSMSQNGIIYVDKQITECSSSPERGCVRYANRQEAGDFIEDNASLDFIPKNIQVRKMVLPTDNPGKFEIALYVRGKSSQTQTSSDKKICSVVVFDKSSSMGDNGYVINPGIGDDNQNDGNGKPTGDDGGDNLIHNQKGDKWYSAVSGAIEFSNTMIEQNSDSMLGLVFFSTSGAIARGLSSDSFNDSLFDIDIGGSTNIHAGLLKAKELFDSTEGSSCDEKYIILMSDGDVNCHTENGESNCNNTDGTDHETPTITRADFLKSNGFKIYSIGYAISSGSSAELTLKYISSDYLDKNEVEDSHTYYYRASVSNINDIFNDIGENQIVINSMKITSIVDSLGSKILGNKINITEETSITESGVVYSFPIRIDPTASGWVNTNSGLILNYINSEGNPDSLVISASKSSQIYWEQPKCDGSYPSGNGVFTGKGEFTQNWIERSGGGSSEGVLKGKDASNFELYPDNLSWNYTGSGTPGECEWTCKSGYQLNQQGNDCEEIVNTHTVNVGVSPEGYGSVDKRSITENYGATISENGNKISIGGEVITATPETATSQYTYEFSGWNNRCGNTLTNDCTITAEFKRSVNKYLITWKNWDGAVLDSGMVEYGTIPVYNGVNPPVRPDDASNTYTFNGWSPVVTGVTNAQVYTAVYISSTNTHTVSFSVDPVGYGSVDNSKVTADHGSSIVVDNSKGTVRVGDVTVRATPKSGDAQYTYEFSGWNNTCGDEVTDDCSITAEFKRSVNKYLITWKNWDGTVLDSGMVEYGTTPVYNGVNPPIRPDDASNTYTFNGWSPVVTGVTNAQVYTAVYISSANTHTVSIGVSPEGYGSVDKNEIVANSGAEIEWIGDTITIGGETVRATPISGDEQYTYEFSGWNLDDCGDILTSSCTIVAEFRSVKNIKLNIVSNNSEYGNVDVSSGYFYPGTLSLFTSGNELRVLKATIGPTKTLLTSIASPNADDEHYNYRFVDWSIPDSCSGQYNFNDDCTVVANFERLANKYLITFVNYDGTVLQQSEMEYGSKPKYMGGTPEKLVEGYTNTFVGWDPEINSTTIVEGAQVYTATFTSVANNYTVLFSGNGAIGEMPGQSFIYGVSQKLSKNSFVMDGYKFIGWNTESNGNGAWYADEESVKNLAMSGEVTLYAQWGANTYIVVFNGNNNTSGSTNNQDMELGESENLNENNFVRDGYTFSGRNTQEDGNGKWYSDEELVNNLASSAGEIVTLYAQWTPNPYTIVFNGNGASTGVMGSQSMVYDVESILNENMFVRDGYIFNGWNTKADGTGKPYSDKSLVKNLATEGTIVLYAQWKTKNSGGSSGGGTKNKDDCPNGDYSGDYYDKKCGSKVKTGKTEVEPEEKPTTVTPVENKTETKKCSIEGSKYSAEVNEAYIWACKNGIIKSQTIQGARLGEFLNRAEMAKIVSIFEMLVLDSKPNRNKDCSAFADSISGYNAEMKNYMITSCQLERMGIHTADHKPIKDFMPKKFVSRAEFGTILSRILRGNKYEAPKNSSKYYVKHLKSLKGEEILSNTNPELKERRSYAILMIYRAAKKLGKA